MKPRNSFLKVAGCAFTFFIPSLTISIAQNLIPNPGFEQISACPTGISQFETNVVSWMNPSNGGANGSPDYFNICGTGGVEVPANSRGFQFPHGGDGYCGIVTARGNYNQNFREYIEAPLISTLEADSCYHFEMYFSLGEISMFNSDSIQVYFSGAAVINVPNAFPLPYTPQISNPPGNFPDTSIWSVMSADYIADGTETHIIIGNFHDSTSTNLVPYNNSTGSNVAFVFIDDVSLVKVPCAMSVAFTAVDNTICPGTCVDYINLSAGGGSYQWIFPGGNPSASTDLSPAGICYNTPGNYGVTLIVTNGGNSDTLTLNNYITVYPFPTPQGILQNGDTLFAIAGATSYQWYFNGNIISGATDYFYVAAQSGNYNVVATDENDCEVEAAINNVIAGLTTFGAEAQGVRLFPNPAGDMLSVIGYTLFETAGGISIYNMLGEVIAVDLSTINYREQTCTLDVSGLSTGIYILEISTGSTNRRVKFLKQ